MGCRHFIAFYLLLVMTGSARAERDSAGAGPQALSKEAADVLARASTVAHVQSVFATHPTAVVTEARVKYAEAIVAFSEAVHRHWADLASQGSRPANSNVAADGWRVPAEQAEARYAARNATLSDVRDAWLELANRYKDRTAGQEALYQASIPQKRLHDSEKTAATSPEGLYQKILSAPGPLTSWKLLAAERLTRLSATPDETYAKLKAHLERLLDLQRDESKLAAEVLRPGDGETEFEFSKRVVDVLDTIAKSEYALKKSLVADASHTSRGSEEIAQLRRQFGDDPDVFYGRAARSNVRGLSGGRVALVGLNLAAVLGLLGWYARRRMVRTFGISHPSTSEGDLS